MLTDLSNTKVRISSEEECIAVQERAFELGWGWLGVHKEVQCTGASSLYFYISDKYKDIKWGGYSNEKDPGFDDFDGKREITVHDILGKPINFKIIKR